MSVGTENHSPPHYAGLGQIGMALIAWESCPTLVLHWTASCPRRPGLSPAAFQPTFHHPHQMGKKETNYGRH